MTNTLTITLCQMNQNVGHMAENADEMLELRRQAAGRNPAIDLVMYPEMQLIGYPPEDMILKPALLDRAAMELQRMALATGDGGPAMIVGTVIREGKDLYNAVALLDGGKIAAVRYKDELPNYGTFDEKRHFTSGPLPDPVEFRGVKIGLPICEDIWHPSVCSHLKEQGAQILLSPNGSPYEIDKDELRIEGVAKQRAIETGLPMAYLNRIGGQDELVFDGASFVINGDGEVVIQMRDWEAQIIDTVWNRTDDGWKCAAGEKHALSDHPEDVYCAMMIAVRDYVHKNGFKGVILGLSGGIDSAICAAIAADALGPENVWCVMMPSRFTSQASLDDATACAKAIGCKYTTIPIQPAVSGFDEMLANDFADTDVDLTEENLQSRIRGVTLMALSNKFGPMLLTTGNKSEMSVGYATIYGDMAGGYNPLKDAYKMTVFAISKWRNTARPEIALGNDGEVIPQNIIEKPPSAELRPDQKDSDSLPDYPVLDAILMGLVERDESVDEIVAEGFDRDVVTRIEHLLHLAEYKRRQAPPGVKLGTRNFGRDRRYPITHKFRTG
ncbi:NAD+ synthase [Altererythrobacter aquiaggeris]|uniref:NAD+ synthase n=1 Tax=Aestuarierythrobacter aquiaggeris TaxID=1898396 RepID=UPI003019C643